MANWLEQILESPSVSTLVERLAGGEARLVVQGSQGSSSALLAGCLAHRLGRPMLMVVAHLDDADDVLEDLAHLTQVDREFTAQRFGALEVLPGESSVNLDLLVERLGLVHTLTHGEKIPQVIVAPIQALMQAIPQADALGQWALPLEVGQDLSPGRLLEWLGKSGYERVDAVEQPGQFAVRGGIIDIYPPSMLLQAGQQDDETDTPGPLGPVRVDYFGDEIDTICQVDPDTMASGRRLKRVQIVGASLDQMQSDDRTTSLWSLLPPQTVVVLSEVLELAEQARGYYERLTNPRGIFAPSTVLKHLTGQHQYLEIAQYGSADDPAQMVQLPVRPLLSFDQDAGSAVEQVGQLAADPDHHVVVLCQKQAERDRFDELLTEHAAQQRSEVHTQVGYLHRGFVWHTSQQAADEQTAGIYLIPHHELFHRYQTHRRIRQVSQAGMRASDAFLEIAAGDYVVHADHGIARFTGLRTMKRGGLSEEYLTLQFAQNALLHVPASEIDLVQKYVGGFQGRPPLSLLGGKRWQKQKEQVAEAVKDLASELLRVQAARASMPGVRYPQDTTWQKEFEAEFPYQETEDQLAAIQSVKKDMAGDQPMDRLICGDVGFGKTEIAIRAAFKAAEFGKQVAVLVPTTVLAEQHERTFRDRMADYPFRIESISRFKSAKQQQQILEALQQGKIDVIVGTHRLLSQDVVFADLGLVVIDEEQRFGVEHKNRLLQFRLTADVLTLSATPIPRTLHMSMLGLRDISSLVTAPMDRRAIVTEVIAYNEQRIRHAIVRELNRQGQVYFVHNRVHNIQSVADDIKRLVPEACVVVGHGQMAGRELEQVMLKFMRRQADILVCTTIIESGLDIPTANTILINAADHFGLAELHQLRGRVGRYKHRAYCYLMLPADRPVSEKAAHRLRAIEQYAMLGAGFKIAMRDLEIRGAGNILGSEQSGHIASVGYDMYCRLLDQQTRRLRNEQVVEPVKTHVELPVAGHLPKSYISSERFRMEAYRRLSRSVSLEELGQVVKDLTDAYGQPPAAAQTLIDLTEIRIAASTLDATMVKLDGPDLIFKTPHPQRLEPILQGAPGRVSVIDPRTIYYRPPANYLTPASTLLAVMRKLLVRPVRGRDVEKASQVSVEQ